MSGAQALPPAGGMCNVHAWRRPRPPFRTLRQMQQSHDPLIPNRHVVCNAAVRLFVTAVAGSVSTRLSASCAQICIEAQV
jgi:hypothetical protein